MPSPNQNLDSKALLADVTRPDTITDLTHEVVSYPHAYRIPQPLDTLFESNLTRAENAYRNNLGPGVSETQLLHLMNTVAAKLKLPEYTKATPAQIRTLRMHLAVSSPHFMGSGLTAPEMKVGDSINPVMSPLQAMHLFSVMVDQKVMNPDYQDPSIDLDKREQERRQERRQEIAKLKQAGSIPQNATHYLSATSNPKHAEMLRAISAGTQSISLEDAYSLVDQTLTDLKLK
jgi:hypothetical protein